MFKGPGKIARDNKSSSYPVFELTRINCNISLKNLSFRSIFVMENLSIVYVKL